MMVTQRNKEDIQPSGARLGAVIRQAREGLGLSLRQLALATDISHSFLLRLEHGEYAATNPENLQRLSRVLELDERDLFSLAGMDAPEGLPAFTPYLRAKYDMPEEAAEQLHEYFNYISAKYDIRRKGINESDQNNNEPTKGGQS